MKKNIVMRSSLSVTLAIGLFLVLLFSALYLGQTNRSNTTKAAANDKQRGAHVFGRIDSTKLLALRRSNFEWLTFVPYGDQKDFDSPTMNYYRGDSLEMLRRDSMWSEQIDIAHQLGFKVFIKPHIWLYATSDGKWRSDIFPTNEENWKEWQKNYREFILLYARLAEKNQVELFCIGTELTRLSVEKAKFWKKLIQEVRSVYSGKITYAANWYEEFEKISFWEDLDFIGVQAYFPLVEHKYPTAQQLSKAWENYLPALESVHKKYNRKILFTEMGYKSTADSAIRPWEWMEHSDEQQKQFSAETQANCYQAFFDAVWRKTWFAGVHIWQWRANYQKSGGMENLDFTPQRKPAEQIIARGFEKIN